MSVKSAPYYWLECDATDCVERCPGPEYEVTAWKEPDGAEANAEESGWRKDDTGRWFCDEHPDCPRCGKPVDDPDMVWADDQLWHQACMPGGAPVGMVQQLIGMPDGDS